MITVAYFMLGASVVVAIAVLVQVRTFLVATVSLNGRAAVRAFVATAVLIGIATLLALGIASFTGLFFISSGPR